MIALLYISYCHPRAHRKQGVDLEKKNNLQYGAKNKESNQHNRSNCKQRGFEPEISRNEQHRTKEHDQLPVHHGIDNNKLYRLPLIPLKQPNNNTKKTMRPQTQRKFKIMKPKHLRSAGNIKDFFSVSGKSTKFGEQTKVPIPTLPLLAINLSLFLLAPILLQKAFGRLETIVDPPKETSCTILSHRAPGFPRLEGCVSMMDRGRGNQSCRAGGKLNHQPEWEQD